MGDVHTANLSLPEQLIRKARRRKQLRTLPLPTKSMPSHDAPASTVNWR